MPSIVFLNKLKKKQKQGKTIKNQESMDQIIKKKQLDSNLVKEIQENRK